MGRGDLAKMAYTDKSGRPFLLNGGWDALLREIGMRPGDLLRIAGLPEDLFRRQRRSVSPEGLCRLFAAVAEVTGEDAPGLVLGHAASEPVFRPELMAAYASDGMPRAMHRLAAFAPLRGPLRLQVHELAGGLEVTVEADTDLELPTECVAAELVFLVSLARRAMRRPARTMAVEMVRPPRHDGYARFFGHAIHAGPFNRVVFPPDEVRRPFMSPDPALFAGFAPDLRLRLDELSPEATLSERVRVVLMEALPAGQPDIATVARRLGTSPRTLQRKLGAEGQSFQGLLRSLRARLSRHYLETTRHSSGEIALLLGYDDPNSFTRAFHDWTGTTPEAYRGESQVGWRSAQPAKIRSSQTTM